MNKETKLQEHRRLRVECKLLVNIKRNDNFIVIHYGGYILYIKCNDTELLHLFERGSYRGGI